VCRILQPKSNNDCSSHVTSTTYSACSQNDNEVPVTSPTLPPRSYIVHLAQVAEFHLNSNQFCFDHRVFLEQMDRSSQQLASLRSGLLLTKVLVVIALGKLFLGKGASDDGPPGIRDFLRSANTLPSNTVFSHDPSMAAETLYLLAIYAQAADMHHVAYLYVWRCSDKSLSTH
jgi:proline utilization trans-activator